jgi:hypothetical protein
MPKRLLYTTLAVILLFVGVFPANAQNSEPEVIPLIAES